MNMNSIEFILNIITLMISILTILISLVILIVIIHYLYYNHIKKKDRVFITLCINIYPLVLVYTILTCLSNTQTLLGDLYDWNFNSSWCIFAGYFSTAILSTLYWVYVNQAFFRLCRIVYSNYKYLQFYWLYILLSPIELILVCLLINPVLVWHDIVYLSNERYCFVPTTNFRGLLWLLFNAYGIPVTLVTSMYFRITLYLRRHATNQTFNIQQRKQRDLIAMQRILVIIGFLMVLGIPAMVFLIMGLITHEIHPLFTRIEFLFVNLSMMGLSLSMVFITPQVKRIILKKMNHNQIIPLNGIRSNPRPIRQNMATA